MITSPFAATIELVGVFIALLVSYLSIRAYNLLKDGKFVYLALGFFLLALNSAAHAALNYLANTQPVSMIAEGTATPLFSLVSILYKTLVILIMIAYGSFVMMYAELKKKPLIILFFIMAALLGTFYFQSYDKFNLVAAMLLSFVVYYTGKNFLEKRTANSLLVVGAFTLLVISHLASLFEANATVHVLKYLILLTGYLSLFIMLLNVTKKARNIKVQNTSVS